MSRYKHRYSGHNHPSKLGAESKSAVDLLLEAAKAASKARNELNYAWVADYEFGDGPGDALRRKLAHVLQLIALVGAADKAWRAVAESRGEPYTPCVDCGWLPQYNARATALREELTEIKAWRDVEDSRGEQ